MDNTDIVTRRITVNGKEMETAALTLAALLEELSLDSSSVVAEVNGMIVPKENFAATGLGGGDTIELVRFVGGG